MAREDINKIQVSVLVPKASLLQFSKTCKLLEAGVDSLTDYGRKILIERAPVIYDNNVQRDRSFVNIQIPFELYIEYKHFGVINGKELIQ
jgi:oligoribonuclease (3'-5' exoribonuclease)